MPSLRTLSPTSSLISFRSHLAFTLRRLEAHPLAAPFAPPFQALLDAWPAVFQEELDLQDIIGDAHVAVITVDDKLNRFADRVSKEVLTLTGEDRNHPLYRHYFGNKPVSVFKRPILGGQLVAMRGWVASLTESDAPSLQAIGVALAPVIAEADKAVADKAEAEQAREAFRDVGARRRFVDAVNAARKGAYGELAKLAHQQLGVPSHFADGFFRRDAVKGEIDAPTVTSVEEEIDALRVQIAGKEALLAELAAKATAEAAKEAARASDLARLAQLRSEVAVKRKEADALQAQLG
jgi:hypothetical protein